MTPQMQVHGSTTSGAPGEKAAKKFGISATPAREALIRLDAEGLVRLVSNTSAYVSGVSFQGLKEAFEVRLVSVEKADALVVCKAQEKDLKSLESLIEGLKRIGVVTRNTFIGVDSEFHELVNWGTGNRTLAKILVHLRNQLFYLGIMREPSGPSKRGMKNGVWSTQTSRVGFCRFGAK